MRLRRLATSDLAEFQAYRNDALLARFQDWGAKPQAEAADFLARMNTAELFRPGVWSQLGIEDADGLLIGDVGLFVAPDGRHAEIGITLSRGSQGRGVATEAVREAIELLFENTDVETVRGIADARNLPSIRLLERSGMSRIDSRGAVFRGDDCVEHTYAVSRR